VSTDQLLERALGAVDRESVAARCAALVDIASPTGDERPLAEWIAGELGERGLSSRVQPIDDRQANAVAELGASCDGPDLMLYAPIDTLTTGDEAEDIPWLAAELPDHARPLARRVGDRVVGLGAHNPKGHAACVMAAIEALAVADVSLRGRVIAAFGAGGMPTNARAASAPRRNTGHGVGASYLLEQGNWADAAVIAKSGWAVAWEEVGLAWVDIDVGGTHTYVGARHRLPYRNPIVDAGRVAGHLEAWFPSYSARHACGLNEPQGIVAAAEAGWWRMAAVVPATARLRVDLRLVPGQSPLDAWRELDAALDELRGGPDPIDVHTRLAVAVPGSRTPPEHWITTTTIAAWERVAGDAHRAITGTSGATDANILRNRGIPTVRVGLPKSFDADRELAFAEGMNTVDVEALEQLTRLLVTIAVLAGSRSREELTGG
jgi:acetylornithine deacetylase/succinyl-diaminopimelate desuccinylase-like protein